MPALASYLGKAASGIARRVTVASRPHLISRRLIYKRQCFYHSWTVTPRNRFIYTSGSATRYKSSRRRSIATAVASSTQDVIETLPVKPSPSLPRPSAEQQFAIDTLLHTRSNIIVDAMAGSGKTTTILHLAQAAPHTKFLVLVYNRRLMVETQERAISLGLTNITIYNYHTLGARFYTPECSTDQGLKRVVEDDMAVVAGKTLPDFSVLVMDEQQDLTPILKRFVGKLIRDKGFVLKNRGASISDQVRIVVLGDQRQQIYSFNNADSRFLTMAGRPEVFGYVNDQPWISAPQTYSNRITRQNVDFINGQLLNSGTGEPPMRAARKMRHDGSIYPKPRYIICDPEQEVLVEIERLLNVSGFRPADILVLAPSTRGMSPAKVAANRLALKGIPVYRADSDVSSPSADVLTGKVLVCTYHQSKGIERPVCIVLGFDQQYHTWYDKQSIPLSVVSNPQYVAATRAMEHLILLHDSKWAPLPFVDLDTINETCEYIVRKPLVESSEPTKAPSLPAKPRVPRYSVVGLCRNLSETVITQCLQKLQVQQVVEPVFPPPAPPTRVVDKYGLVEWTAAITGTAVPALFEWSQRRKLTILDDLLPKGEPKKWIKDLPEDYQQKLQHISQKVNTGRELSTGDILYVAHLSMADIDKDFISLLSMPFEQYTWISDSYLSHVIAVLKHIPKPANITKTARYELWRPRRFLDIEVGSAPVPMQPPGILLGGRMDMVRLRKEEDSVVWEVKHMDTLQPEHIIQTALYILLLKRARGYLVSARSGHAIEVTLSSSTSLHEMLQILVGAKSGGPQAKLLHKYSDEEFLAEAAQDFAGLVGKCALPAWFSMKPQRSRFKRRGYKYEANVLVQDDDADLIV